MNVRHFLFLQGLPGPSMRRIARRIQLSGHRTSRINFNGGDLADWHFGGAAYCGGAQDFGPWLGGWTARNGVTDLVLFGDRRPLHQAAIAVARQHGLDVHVLEEGYLRPNSIAIERWSHGEPWQPPRDLADCRQRLRTAPAPEVAIENRFTRRWFESVAYWTWATMLWPLFPRYRSHRTMAAPGEVVAWLRRYARGGQERDASLLSLAQLGSAPFFLFPLQLDGDAQLVHRSPFASMEQAAAAVLASFARAAPAGMRLLVKRHPFDPDPQIWRRRIAALGAQIGLGERLHYVEHADLDPLLDRCQGVITVNSTVGGLALRRGVPVHALGQALYAMPGLASSGEPDRFWSAPSPVAHEDFDAFCGALWNDCLINAGFHSASALDRLEQAAAARLVGAAA